MAQRPVLRAGHSLARQHLLAGQLLGIAHAVHAQRQALWPALDHHQLALRDRRAVGEAQPAGEVEHQDRLAVHLQHLAQIGGSQRERAGAGLVQDRDDRLQGQADLHAARFDEERGQAPRALLQTRVLQHLPDQRQKVLRADRLGEERARTALQARLGPLLLGGDDDDRNAGEVRVALHLRQHLVAVHLGHGQVEEHRGGPELGHLGERLAPVQRGGEQVVSRQRCLLEGQHRFAVVHEQEVRKAHAASPSQRRTAAWSSAA